MPGFTARTAQVAPRLVGGIAGELIVQEKTPLSLAIKERLHRHRAPDRRWPARVDLSACRFLPPYLKAFWPSRKCWRLDGGSGKDLCFAAVEKAGAMQAGEYVHFAANRLDFLLAAAVNAAGQDARSGKQGGRGKVSSCLRTAACQAGPGPAAPYPLSDPGPER
jgi:hypothetical protein